MRLYKYPLSGNTYNEACETCPVILGTPPDKGIIVLTVSKKPDMNDSKTGAKIFSLQVKGRYRLRPR